MSLRSDEGVNITRLEPGTKLTIETMNSFYEMTVRNGPEVTLFGGTMQDGSTRFTEPTSAIFVGTTWGGSAVKLGWLGRDLFLEFILLRSGKQVVMTTSPVRNVVLEAADGSWSYSMDWRTNPPKSS